MKITGKQLWLPAMWLLLLAGCSVDNTDERDYADNRFVLASEQTTLDFAREARQLFIPVATSLPAEAWLVSTGDASWLTVTKIADGEQKGLCVAVAESEEPEVRTAVMTVSAGAALYELLVRQLGYGPAILVDDKTVGNGGGTIEIGVTTNIDVVAESPDFGGSADNSWLEVLNDGLPLTRALVHEVFELFAETNFGEEARSATVTFRGADEEYASVTALCTITQGVGVPPAVLPGAQDDEQVRPSSAAASSYQPGSGPDKLIDGQKESDADGQIFHSNWDEPNSFPITWTFNFKNGPTIDYFILYARSGNGQPGCFNVSYIGTGTDGLKMIAYDGETPSADNPLGNFGQMAGVHRFDFPYSLEGVEQIVITWYDGSGGFLSAREIEFYKNNHMTDSDGSALLDVFTDLSCSELRSGVTLAQIAALYGVSPYIAEEVAMKMYDNTFPTFNDEKEKEFRIHTYEAYSDVGRMYSQFRTRRYSPFDNPTGIWVEEGERLIVCVDKIPSGHTVSLAIAGEASNGYTARYDGFDQSVTLNAGINEVQVEKGGLCYILNTARTLTSSSEAVKVHFLPEGGHVDGYADISRHSDAECNKLVNAAQYKYFVMKGYNMMFLMHTDYLKLYTSTGAYGLLSGLDAWDQIIGWQWEAMGIAKDLDPQKSTWYEHRWDRMVDDTHFNNHMLAVSNTNTSVYMDASDYRVNFQVGTLRKIITRAYLTEEEDNTWGPAHEAGHVNQIAINWKSTSESSNNLFSNIAIKKMGVYGSRGRALSYLASSYAEKRPWIYLGTSSEGNGEDPEMHMRMNWQLWNYFHRCEVDTEFFPRLFGLLRGDEYRLPNEYAGLWGAEEDSGLCQLTYAKAVCEAAKMDFTDFFDAWGFFVPVTVYDYSDYGTDDYIVTQQMVDEFKSWIKAKGYPKAPAVQYIEDRNSNTTTTTYGTLGYYTTFMNKTAVTKSNNARYTMSQSGSSYNVSVTGVTGAVAIELRKAPSGSEELGELVYFYPNTSFTLPSSLSSSATSLKVYAVQWDSERIEISSR